MLGVTSHVIDVFRKLGKLVTANSFVELIIIFMMGMCYGQRNKSKFVCKPNSGKGIMKRETI